MKKDALETIGHLISEDEIRDVVHIACLPARAIEVLQPGQRVGYKDGEAHTTEKPIGIVDPFLNQSVFPGQCFWIMLFPRSITGLRHLWTHPELPEHGEHEKVTEKDQQYAREVLEGIARKCGVTFSDLIGIGNKCVEGKEVCLGYVPERYGLPNYLQDDYWDAWSRYTGCPRPEGEKEVNWRCAY